MKAAGCSQLALPTQLTAETFDSYVISATGFKKLTEVTATRGQGKTGECGLFQAADGDQSTNESIEYSRGSQLTLGLGAVFATTAQQPNRPCLADFSGADSKNKNTVFGQAHAAIQAMQQTTEIQGMDGDEATILKTLANMPRL
ncbi:Trypanosome variant surface glycoprotein (A-type), putative [Trypanosoma equiperdum]|uniref:Trypanosome variant surface glycoprotein (A-type), putative n=1 Tax=Trypanosoma equiperdum TaxID=5694 RepID=A0A1G4I1Y6_TRYEQ|nr:Trypanosome variant surface glycoprotein (A-type), putative [Trypanosoma equiperdum]